MTFARLETKYGIVVGRFQPLHLGHLEYLEAARARCDRLVIGVTNPDVANLIDDSADLNRSRPENNPFSYFDRHEMIIASMIENGWNVEEFTVVPADINRIHSLEATLPPPSKAIVFVTIYDDWGDRKNDLLSGMGYQVEVMWRRTMVDRLTSGTAIRGAIRSGEPWKHLVPSSVASYLEGSHLNTAHAGWPSNETSAP